MLFVQGTKKINVPSVLPTTAKISDASYPASFSRVRGVVSAGDEMGYFRISMAAISGNLDV